MAVEFGKVFAITTIFITGFCVIAVLASVLINFIDARQRQTKTKQEKRSVVATGTMMLFFFMVYLIIVFRIGTISTVDLPLRILCGSIGSALVILGCVVNIKGRLALGKNWANQIKIYEEQSLVTSGVYRWVRHPLYASLIWMFLGASLVYCNYMAFAATVLVFIPFMYYRAKQEETLLEQQFEAYHTYRQTVGMFFPKLWRR